MQSFEDLSDHIVYTFVKSRGDAVKLKDSALEAVAAGKTVVIFFENRYHLHLSPGQDPYQVRQDIDKWVTKQQSKTEGTSSAIGSSTSETKRARPSLR
jgi:hypothetical protein